MTVEECFDLGSSLRRTMPFLGSHRPGVPGQAILFMGHFVRTGQNSPSKSFMNQLHDQKTTECARIIVSA